MPPPIFIAFLFSIFDCLVMSEGMRNKYPSASWNLSSFLLRDYDPNVRPLLNSSGTVVIDHFLSLQQIVKVDPNTETVEMHLHEEMTWTDEYLTWNPKHFGNISDVSLMRHNIWLPDATVMNKLAAVKLASRDVPIPAKVNSQGRVWLSTPLRINVICQLEMPDFPFDTQTFTVEVGSWSQPASDLEIVNAHTPCMDISHFTLNSEWNLLSISCDNQVVPSSLHHNQHFSRLKYMIRLERRSGFFTRFIILPTILISFLSIVVFYMPCDSGQKVGYIISLFLTQVFNIVLISGFIPVSIQLPVISKYCLISIVLTWLACYLTIIILAGYHSPQTFSAFSQNWRRNIFQMFSTFGKYLQVPIAEQSGLRSYLSCKNLHFSNCHQLNAVEGHFDLLDKSGKSGEGGFGKSEVVDHSDDAWRYCLLCLDRMLAAFFFFINMTALILIIPYYIK